MVIQKVLCSHCQSEDIKRDGHTAGGKQCYKCKGCGRISRENPQYDRYNAAQKEQILRAYNERSSMRGIPRVFGVSRPPHLHRNAGGGLAASLAILARDRGEVAVVFQMLVYAMLDYKTGSTREKNPNEFTGEFVWTRQNNAYGWSSLLGSDTESRTVSPYASASQAEDLSGLPPAFLAVGSLDLFVDEDMNYAHRLIRAGVATELHVFPGAFHGFDLVPGTSLAETLHRQQKEALKSAFSAK